MVDLGRRLLLTSGLILIGAQSNTQIFLGSLLCLIWLLLVVVRRPYVAYWDNVLSAVLSLQLVLIMLCGTALKMNSLTPQEAANDPYEKTAFGMLMVTFSIFIIVTSICSIIITIPCLRDRIVKLYVLRCGSVKKNKQAEVRGKEDNKNDNETKNDSEQMLITQTRVNSSFNTTFECQDDIEMSAVSIGSGSKNVTNPLNKVTQNKKNTGERRITTKRLSKVIKARQNHSESKQ